MKSVLIAIALGAGQTAAATPDWRFVTLGGGTTVLMVDLQSIKKLPDNHRSAETFAVLKVDSNGAAAMQLRAEVDCSAHRQKQLYLTALDQSGKELFSGDPGKDFSPITAGTPAADLEQYICTGGASKPTAPSLGATVPIPKIREMILQVDAKK